MAKGPGWFEERLELSKLAWLGTRKVPKGVTWWYTFGSATLVTFIMLVVTGIFLVMNYSPSPDHAWDRGQDMTRNEARCTSCGACITVCPAGAFEIQPETRLVLFDNEKCVACGLCLKTCPPRAMEVHF